MNVNVIAITLLKQQSKCEKLVFATVQVIIQPDVKI